MEIRVAGAQLPVSVSVKENTARIIEAIDHAAVDGAEILLTPEGSLSGYTHFFDAAVVREALGVVRKRASEKSVGLALGTCFVEDDGLCYNQIRFYKPDGEYLGFHAKTLRCGTLSDPPEGEIRHFAGAGLRVFEWTQWLTIGGLICNDMWANPECTPMPDPHLSQQLSTMGARIVFHAVNGGRDGGEWSKVGWAYHESNLRIRARAGNSWIVTVDNSHPGNLPCSAPSGVIAPSGDFVVRAKAKGEGLFIYTINLD